MFIALPILVLFIALSNGQIHDGDTFSLFMTGSCESTGANTGNCTLKGNSQSISTLISPSDDALRFTIENHIGSYALLTSKYTFDGKGGVVETGTITFGTHTDRDHTILYSVSGTSFVNSKILTYQGKTVGGQDDLMWHSMSGSVTGGLGVFEGYTGVITAAGANNGFRVFGLVSGHIWKK